MNCYSWFEGVMTVVRLSKSDFFCLLLCIKGAKTRFRLYEILLKLHTHYETLVPAYGLRRWGK